MTEENTPGSDRTRNDPSDRRTTVEGDIIDSTVVTGDHNQITIFHNKTIQISASVIQTRKLISASPYKGLKGFGLTDKEKFFGRDQLIESLLAAVQRQNHCVLVAGASGSGKSSVVRAGLIPQLDQHFGSRFQHFIFTPDHDPFDSLYRSLRNPELIPPYSESDAEIAKIARADTLMQVVRTLKLKTSQWLFFVDQFEELFTRCQDSNKRKAFIEGLLRIAHSGDPSIRLVVAMRSDFLDQIGSYPKFGKLAEQTICFVADMHTDELRLAIEQPAAQHGVVFEDGLVEEIIKGVQGQAGYLPLLQYTLDLLWETEVKAGDINTRTLHIRTYRALGGVRGALQNHVEQIYEGLSEAKSKANQLPSAKQVAAQRIFLKLVEIGGNAEAETEWKPLRRRARRSEFTDEQEQAVLKHLINKNLLVSNVISQSDGTTPVSTIEIAHEILLTSWSRLNEWIQEYQHKIALRNRLNDDVARWQTKKVEDELWSGSKLEQVVDLKKDSTFNQVMGGFSSTANEFIEASVGRRDRIQKQRNRQRRRIIFGLITGLLISLSLAGIAWWQWLNSQTSAYTASSEAFFNSNRDFDALIESLKAAKLVKQWQFAVNHDNRIKAITILRQAVYGQTEINRLEGHLDFVWDVKFSPDGRTIATASADGTVKIWSPDGTLLKTIYHPKGGIGIIFNENQDEKLIITSTIQGKPAFDAGILPNDIIIRIDNQNIEGIGIDEATNLLLGEVGTEIQLTVQRNDQQLDFRLKRVTLEDTPVFPVSKVFGLSFNPDGNLLATASGRSVKLWSLDGNLFKTLEGHTDGVRSVSFSPDGETIASASEDGTVKLWSLDGNIIQSLSHPDKVQVVNFSPSGHNLVSATWDGKIYLWSHAGVLLKTIQGYEGISLQGAAPTVWSVSFSPDSQILAAASTDGIRLWDLEGNLIGFLAQEGNYDAIFSPDGKTLAVSRTGGSIELYRDGHLFKTLTGHFLSANALSFSPDGEILASSSQDGTVKLWKPYPTEPITLHTSNFNLIGSRLRARFSPDGKMIATANSDGVEIWDRYGNQVELPTQEPGFDAGAGVSFSSDSKMIAFGYGKTIKIFNFNGGEPKKINLGEEYSTPIFDVSFSPDNQIVAGVVFGGEGLLWDLNNEKQIPLKEKRDLSWDVNFSPDGQTIATASWQSINLWKRDGSLLKTLSGHFGHVYDVSFSSDGKLIVSAGENIKLWKRDGSLIRTFYRNGSGISSANFSPDNKILATAGKDGAIKFWNVEGEELHTLRDSGTQIDEVSFSPDGKLLASVGKGSESPSSVVVTLWNLDFDDLVIRGCQRIRGYLKSSPNVSDRNLCDNIPTSKSEV